MKIIIFFTTLICSMLIGLGLGILDLKTQQENFPGKEFKKFHRILLRINFPFLKIFLSLLYLAVIVLCWYEARFTLLPTYELFFTWLICLCGVFFVSLSVYLLLQPTKLHKRNLFTLYPNSWKQSFYGNLSIVLSFIIIAMVTFIYKGKFDFDLITYSAGCVLIFSWLIFVFLKIIKGLGYVLKNIYFFAKNLNKEYWRWVLKQ